MRIVSLILIALFVLTGTGAAGHLHGAERAQPKAADASTAACEVLTAAAGEHDAAHCAICVAITATRSAFPDVECAALPPHRLVARRLAIERERPGTIALTRPSCRDPPVV